MTIPRGRSLGTHHAKKTMVKGMCAVSARLFWSTALLAAVSGCGQVPVWINGKYYGPSSDVAAPQPIVAAPPREIILRAKTPTQAQVDPALSEELDQLYQKLMELTPENAHDALAQEQYDWRNRREILCTQDGVFNAQCGNEITSERIAELSARVDQFSGAGASVLGASIRNCRHLCSRALPRCGRRPPRHSRLLRRRPRRHSHYQGPFRRASPRCGRPPCRRALPRRRYRRPSRRALLRRGCRRLWLRAPSHGHCRYPHPRARRPWSHMPGPIPWRRRRCPGYGRVAG